MGPAPDPDGHNPFVGPRPFERTDSEGFFGREVEAREIVSTVLANQVTLLYAASGAGKTSLLNAGVLPLLVAGDDFETLPPARVQGLAESRLPPGANPFVANVISHWIGPDDPRGVGLAATLAEVLAARPRPSDALGLPAPRLVMIDQLEELFTAYSERWTDRGPFLEQLAGALEADPLLRVILAIREEYLAQLDSLAHLLPGGLRARLRLERLGGEAALEAVTGPVARTSRSFARGVAERLVDDLLELHLQDDRGTRIEVRGEYVEPVQLQVVCRRLWETLPPGARVIGEDDLRRVGDLDEVLGEFYEDAVQAAAGLTRRPERRLRADVERVFITPGGTRGTAYRGSRDTDGIPNVEVEELERRHLLRAERRAGALWYELTHDRLIDPIQRANARAAQRRAGSLRWRLGVAGIAGLLVAAVVGVAVGIQTSGDSSADVTPLLAGSTATVPVGSDPSDVALGAGRLWVTNYGDDTISAINPVSGRVDTIQLTDPGAPHKDKPTGVAADETNVWVTDQGTDTVTKLDAAHPRDSDLRERIPVGDRPQAVAVARGTAWVANYGGKSVTQIGPGSPSDRSTIGVGHDPRGVAVYRGVWVTNSGDDTVTAINADHPERTPQTIDVGRKPMGIAVDMRPGGLVWVANSGDGTVSRIDPGNPQRRLTPVPVGGAPFDVTVGQGKVWVSTKGNDQVVAIDPLTRAVEPVVRTSTLETPRGIVTTLGTVWVVDGPRGRLVGFPAPCDGPPGKCGG